MKKITINCQSYNYPNSIASKLGKFPSKLIINKWLKFTDTYIGELIKVNNLTNSNKANILFNKKLLKILSPRHNCHSQLISILITDKKKAGKFNQQFRNKDYSPNVLSFADFIKEQETLLIDIIICLPVVISQAKEYGITFKAHLAHLIIHGYLHGLGFDHQQENEQKIMEAVECDILKTLGFNQPY